MNGHRLAAAPLTVVNFSTMPGLSLYAQQRRYRLLNNDETKSSSSHTYRSCAASPHLCRHAEGEDIKAWE